MSTISSLFMKIFDYVPVPGPNNKRHSKFPEAGRE